MTPTLPGNGLFGWLGRQVGYIRRSLRCDVTTRVLYRTNHIQEASPPDQPDLLLRRTTIDEVIINNPKH
jgi:hypothetical protein